LNIYRPDQLEVKPEDREVRSRFFEDKNVNHFDHFIIDNYRRDMSFNYLSWKVIEDIGKRKIKVNDLSSEYIEELLYTILPDNRTLIHFLQNNYEALTNILNFITEDPDELESKSMTISDVPFIPDIRGITPIHESIE
jgi:hypothetical protein